MLVVNLGFCFDPVVHERRLHLRNCRSLQTEMRIAPMFRGIRRPRPFVGDDPHSPGEAYPPVNNEQFSMSSMIHSRKIVPTQGVISFDFNSGRFHIVQQRAIDLSTPQPIQ